MSNYFRVMVEMDADLYAMQNSYTKHMLSFVPTLSEDFNLHQEPFIIWQSQRFSSGRYRCQYWAEIPEGYHPTNFAFAIPAYGANPNFVNASNISYLASTGGVKALNLQPNQQDSNGNWYVVYVITDFQWQNGSNPGINFTYNKVDAQGDYPATIIGPSLTKSITVNLENCTSDIARKFPTNALAEGEPTNIFYYPKDYPLDVVLTANNGAEFTEAHYQYSDSDTLLPLSISQDLTTASGRVNISSDVIISGTASEPVVPPDPSNITFNLTNCTHNLDLDNNDYNVGDEVTIVLTANLGYEFYTTGATVDIDGTSSTFAPSQDKKTITIPITLGSVVTITANARLAEYPGIISTTNCTASGDVSQNTYQYGSTVTLIFDADEGYIFDSADTINNRVRIKTGDNPETYDVVYLSVSEDMKRATVAFTQRLGFTATATAVRPTSNITFHLTNCTHNLDFDNNQYRVGDEVTVVLTPNDGYKFTDAAVVDIDSNFTNYSPVSDGSSITFTIILGSIVEVTATATPIPQLHSITSGVYWYSDPYLGVNRGGGTIYSSTNEAYEGDVVTMHLQVDDGYVFDRWVSTPPVDFNEYGQFTMPDSDIVVQAVVRKTITVTPILEHCTCTIDGANCCSPGQPGETQFTFVSVDCDLVADEGYTFDNGSILVYETDTGRSVETTDWTYYNDSHVIFTIRIKEENITIAASAVSTTPVETYPVTVLSNEDNYGYAYASPSLAPEGSTVTLVPVSYEGYEFDSWIVNTDNVTITNNQFTMPDEGVVVTAVFKESSVTPETPISVTGILLNKNSTTLQEGTSETLIAIVLPSNATNKNVTWKSSNSNVSVNNNGVIYAKNTGVAVITATTADGNYTASCTVIVTSPTQTNLITFNLTNCTHNLTNLNPLRGTTINLVLTADDGCEFNNRGKVVIEAESEFLEDDIYYITDISQDKKTATITFRATNFTTITMVASPVMPEQLGGLTNLYKITTEQLRQVTSQIYPRTSDGQIPSLSALENVSKFFVNLIEFPFDIETLVPDQVIKLGYISTDVVTNGIPVYLYEVNLGSIHVDTKYNNYYDTIGTVRLFLPYVGDITLPIEQVVGQTISIKYIVNLFSGQTTVNIYSSLNNVLIHSSYSIIGIELPFYEYRDRAFKSDLEFMAMYNEVDRPYLEITRNKPYNIDNQFGKPTVDYGTLGDYVGYIQCGNVDITTDATVDEKALIQQLLRAGVIINTVE